MLLEKVKIVKNKIKTYCDWVIDREVTDDQSQRLLMFAADPQHTARL